MKEVDYNKLSGEKIKEARLAKNMTEQDLAYSLDPDNYEKTTKLIKYWEKGNGFPDLNQIYKLAEIIEINPNEIYYYRENGRKQFKENKKRKQLTERQYAIKSVINRNLEDLMDLLPVFFMLFVFIVWFKGWIPIYNFFKKISHFLGFI